MFNASLHYSTDYVRTIGEALRVLRPGGKVVVMDSPIYRRDDSGRQMVAERHADFERRFGTRSDSVASIEYLTDAMLGELAEAAGAQLATAIERGTAGGGRCGHGRHACIGGAHPVASSCWSAPATFYDDTMTSNIATSQSPSGSAGTVQFTRMADGTRDEYQYLHGLEREYISELPERLVEALRRLDDGLAGYQISRYQHSLQTATRAMRDGADIEMIVAALIHDIGDDLSPENHSQVAAAIIRPYVRAEVTWVVNMHGIFQMKYYAHHIDLDPDLARGLPRSPLVRQLRQLLRAVGSGVVRSRLPDRADRDVRADAARDLQPPRRSTRRSSKMPTRRSRRGCSGLSSGINRRTAVSRPLGGIGARRTTSPGAGAWIQCVASTAMPTWLMSVGSPCVAMKTRSPALIGSLQMSTAVP